MYPSAPSAKVKVKHAARQTSAPSGHKSLEDVYRLQYNNTNPSKSMSQTSVRSMPTSPAGANEVAAYVLQPDGTMAAVRWDDKSALEKNQTVLEALREEREARLRGYSSGKVRNVNNTGAALQTDVLQWLAGDEATTTPTEEKQLQKNFTDKSDAQWRGRQRSTTAAYDPSIFTPSLQTQAGAIHSPKTSIKASKNNLKILRVSDNLNGKETKRIGSPPLAHSSSPPTAHQRQFHSKQFQVPANRSPGPTERKSTTDASGSAQVQESYWSPGSHRLSRQTADYHAHTSTQQRQLSVEKAVNQRLNSSGEESSGETSVWECFKFDERCAVTDF